MHPIPIKKYELSNIILTADGNHRYPIPRLIHLFH
jgi:hypothetical protein